MKKHENRARAIVVDIGAELTPRKSVELRQTGWITELTRRLLFIVSNETEL